MICELYLNKAKKTIYNEHINYFIPEIILGELVMKTGKEFISVGQLLDLNNLMRNLLPTTSPYFLFRT